MDLPSQRSCGAGSNRRSLGRSPLRRASPPLPSVPASALPRSSWCAMPCGWESVSPGCRSRWSATIFPPGGFIIGATSRDQRSLFGRFTPAAAFSALGSPPSSTIYEMPFRTGRPTSLPGMLQSDRDRRVSTHECSFAPLIALSTSFFGPRIAMPTRSGASAGSALNASRFAASCPVENIART